ncbi:phosphotransferase [Asanoa sp. NPDC049573]|uniref:phosphotransferase family protein n=1 Tax=Asanoa sp. NPDC049573 TaxID=3155396 RepID=UPI003421E3D1
MTDDECLLRLGRDPSSVRSTESLAGSASGSRVALLHFHDGERLVLKTTTPREVALYRAAARLPVRTPRLVAADDTCLLLEALEPLPPPNDWPTGQWHEVARQLGTLHAMPLDHSPRWLKQPVARQPDQIARAFWSATELALLDLVVDDKLPTCLLHGDLHAGNLLRAGDGGLVWTDWQEVGVGQGPEDLALLWQRAEADGADPPREAMLATYAAARGLAHDETLIRATNTAEIRLLLLDWPWFLRRADPSRRALMRRRLHLLAATRS